MCPQETTLIHAHNNCAPESKSLPEYWSRFLTIRHSAPEKGTACGDASEAGLPQIAGNFRGRPAPADRDELSAIT
jgi:hypothetical protein